MTPADDGRRGRRGPRGPAAGNDRQDESASVSRPTSAGHGPAVAGARWQALWREAAEGASREGDEPLAPAEVDRLACQLRAMAAQSPAVPADLVPQVTRALARALAEPVAPGADAEKTGPESPSWPAAADVAGPGLGPAVPAPSPRRPSLAQLAALVGAEARWLPLPFLVMQLVLAVGGLLLHMVALRLAASRTAGWGAAAAGGPAGTGLHGWQLILASADALALVAPWLGTVVALAAAWPRRRQLWADLETLSPFPPASRLLVRTAVAGILATAVLLLAGWLQPAVVLTALGDGLPPAPAGAVAGSGLPGGGPVAAHLPGARPAHEVPAAWMAAVVLARVAPLWLAAVWALWWQVRAGTLGAMAASAALWTVVTLGGRFLGPWNPLAAGPLPAAGVQLAMLAGALVLAWHLRGAAEPEEGRMGGQEAP